MNKLVDQIAMSLCIETIRTSAWSVHVVPKLEKRTHGESVTKYGTIQNMFPIGIYKFQRGKNTRIDERIQKLN